MCTVGDGSLCQHVIQTADRVEEVTNPPVLSRRDWSTVVIVQRCGPWSHKHSIQSEYRVIYKRMGLMEVLVTKSFSKNRYSYYRKIYMALEF